MRRFAMALAAAMALLACTSAMRSEPAPLLTTSKQPIRPLGPPLRYAFTALDGKRLGAASMKGRMTVIGFAATYDTASQAQARFLKSLLRRHVPRINVMLVVLEPAHHLPLVRAFANSLSLPYPVVMADEATIAGEGPFQGLHHVPSVVLLDREGRERWRKLGLVTDQVLSERIRAYQ